MAESLHKLKKKVFTNNFLASGFYVSRNWVDQWLWFIIVCLLNMIVWCAKKTKNKKNCESQASRSSDVTIMTLTPICRQIIFYSQLQGRCSLQNLNGGMVCQTSTFSPPISMLLKWFISWRCDSDHLASPAFRQTPELLLLCVMKDNYNMSLHSTSTKNKVQAVGSLIPCVIHDTFIIWHRYVFSFIMY